MRTRSNSKLLQPFQRRLPPNERKLKLFAAELDSKRSCGSCTACCDVIGVEEIHKPEFTPCKHLCGTGCKVYQNRPQQCRNYMCGYKALWTPNDEKWRPDNLGVIFDAHKQAMGERPAVRCWQLRSETQILDDPNVRIMAYALADQLKVPVVARYGNVFNISVHLISQLAEIRFEIDKLQLDPPILSYLLTPDVISDLQDFTKGREILPRDELDEITNQFGFKAFRRHMGLR